MTVLYSLTFVCSQCGADVETSVVPMADRGFEVVRVDPRPLNAHALDEHGVEPFVDSPPGEEPLDSATVYDDATPGSLYVPPPGTPDPTEGDPLPDPEGETPAPEEDPTA
jgi:hypothetical protein